VQGGVISPSSSRVGGGKEEMGRCPSIVVTVQLLPVVVEMEITAAAAALGGVATVVTVVVVAVVSTVERGRSEEEIL
jgi:hypothetical protein